VIGSMVSLRYYLRVKKFPPPRRSGCVGPEARSAEPPTSEPGRRWARDQPRGRSPEKPAAKCASRCLAGRRPSALPAPRGHMPFRRGRTVAAGGLAPLQHAAVSLGRRQFANNHTTTPCPP